jgi:hypothetical protein
MAVFSAIGGAVASGQAKKAAKRARADKARAQAELDSIKASRQQIRNPYASTEDLSGLATDLSSQLSNPFESLGVATKAAEIQIEQADISLANTLDTLRATGASAGGATALAQASIEQQEAQNEKLRAQGEQNLLNAKMSEQQRMQSIAISEGQRVQATEAAGQQFMFQAQENRTNMDLDRAAGQISQAQAQEASANQAKAAAWSNALSSIGGNLTSVAVGGGFAKGGLGKMFGNSGN